jgi:hypothetical protein
MVSDRDVTESGHGGSPESTGTETHSDREPPLCLNTKKCSRKKLYLSDCSHTEKDKDIVLLSGCKKKRDADKQKVNFLTLENNGATADSRDGQTA